jgi:hypothetical protein
MPRLYKLDERPSIFTRDKPIISSERMLQKDYDHKGSVTKKKKAERERKEKKGSGHVSRGLMPRGTDWR